MLVFLGFFFHYFKHSSDLGAVLPLKVWRQCVTKKSYSSLRLTRASRLLIGMLLFPNLIINFSLAETTFVIMITTCVLLFHVLFTLFTLSLIFIEYLFVENVYWNIYRKCYFKLSDVSMPSILPQMSSFFSMGFWN